MFPEDACSGPWYDHSDATKLTQPKRFSTMPSLIQPCACDNGWKYNDNNALWKDRSVFSGWSDVTILTRNKLS